MFPEELPKRLIKMFSFFGETIFDPFLGSGTTSLAAKNLGRNSIGYEINKEFEPIIRKKVNINQLSFDIDTIEFFEDNDSYYSLEKLPYIFSDPHKLDKKIDIKKLKFGSKIDDSKEKREDLFSVKEVISPNKILLNNGMEIKLLGIKEKDNFTLQAINYLKEKFNKRKIYLKYDLQKYDKNNNLMCYVYLDNKTFINNHLIRTGFVDVETNFDYSCKSKFIKSLPI